jgi:hypothetical protein
LRNEFKESRNNLLRNPEGWIEAEYRQKMRPLYIGGAAGKNVLAVSNWQAIG